MDTPTFIRSTRPILGMLGGVSILFQILIEHTVSKQWKSW